VEELNLEGLKTLIVEDPATRTLVEYVTRKADVSITTAEELEVILNEKGITRDRPEQVKLLQKLAKLGCGEYRNGRKNSRTRIMWFLNRIHGNAVKELLAGKTDVRETKEVVEGGDTGIREVMLSHTYPLRSKLSVQFMPPENLTQVEASRLARHIETLPFSQGSVA
jgi:hypothetical protein